MKLCKECTKEFEPKNPKGIFCSISCRQKDYRKKVALQLVIYRASLVPLPPDYVEIKKGGVINSKGQIDDIKINMAFGDDKWLQIEKYTKYPSKEMPEKEFDRAKWKADKKASDDLIRADWNRQQKIKNK